MIVIPCKFPFNSIKHQGKIPMFMVILIAKSFPTFPTTSPWKKCTIVAGSAAGSRLPTKELSTRTAPQGASKGRCQGPSYLQIKGKKQKNWFLGWVTFKNSFGNKDCSTHVQSQNMKPHSLVQQWLHQLHV